ncbi:MFS transporter [Methylocaldum sp. RMAD-M]|uniref:MFS transporter n=1 Tax=Methylocaldum sp. RMAD-M TaxID=2806557 RepID=UPI001B6D918A|nr:putative MFS family arabinose efflux permease [Methylocaldum sp. RMAD-M]
MNPTLQLDTPMTRAEVRASLSLAAIYMLRMLGMFLILPVLSVFARELPDASPQLVGFAISAYGLTQAIFQIPFGLWSDRYGRKRLIVLGLLLFAAGSALAALSDSIYGIIAGRALQGAGAVAGVIMALAADLTREEHRTKAMALIGISIGMSFALSMVIGPVLSGWMGLHGLFWIITALALLGIVVLYSVVPTPAVSRFHRDTEVRPASLKTVLANRELLRLDLGIFCLHLVLTATFVVLPLILRDSLQLETANHWHIYLPVFGLALASMVPFVILAEKKRKMKAVFVSFIALIVLSDVGFTWLQHDFWIISGLLYLFFTGFNLLEATLPSLVSKTAPLDLKGTAMGVYSTAQFLGAFVGGAGGGWIYGRYGIPYVFLFCAAVALLWFIFAIGMKAPRGLSSLLVNVNGLSHDQASSLSRRLLQVPGVAEAVVLAEDGVAYLKIDKEKLDRMALSGLLQEVAA